MCVSLLSLESLLFPPRADTALLPSFYNVPLPVNIFEVYLEEKKSSAPSNNKELFLTLTVSGRSTV